MSTMSNEKFAIDIVTMPDSNYLVGTNGDDWQLTKINQATGDTIWTRNYDSLFYYKYSVNCMDYATNNNCIIGMHSYFMLIDANGDSIWKKPVPFAPYTSISDVHTTLDGGYAFCGQYYNSILGYKAIIFVKLDSLGNTVFTSVFNPEDNLQPLAFYPNPAENEINISPGSMAMERNLLFTLCDLQGRGVLQQQYDATKPVDVSTLPEGLYIATLKGKEKELRGKVMIQR